MGELVRRGKLTEQQAEEHPQRSVITRALGPEASVEVDSFSFGAQPGDVFLLCSDGLTSMVAGSRRWRTSCARPTRSTSAARRLIDAANENGGRDNITVVLFRIEGVPEAADTDADQPTVVGEKAAHAQRRWPPPRRGRGGTARRGAPRRCPPRPSPRRRASRAAAAGSPRCWPS